MSAGGRAGGRVPGTRRLPPGYTLKSWLLTTDHKRIGLLYMASITFFFFVGGAAATVMRLELMTPRGTCSPRPTPTTSCSPCTAW